MNLDYKKAALLIIDMQKGFVEPGAALCVPTAKATIPAINSVIDKCRAEGAKIIWVKREYAADGSDVEIPRRKALEEGGLLGVLAPGTTGINSPEDAEGLEPLEGDTTIIKPRFISFLKTEEHGYEVDFAVGDAVYDDGLALYQVTDNLDSSEVRDRETRALWEAMRERGCRHSTLIVGDGAAEILEQDGFRIDVVPLWDWLRSNK